MDYFKAFDCVGHNKLWKIMKEMGIPDHLTCLLRNFYAGQEARVRTAHGTTDWFQLGKGVHQAVYCHPAYLTSMQSTSWETLDWNKHKLELRLLGEVYRWHHPYGRKWRTKEPLDERERGQKVSVKVNIQKTYFMASVPITSWQIDVEIVETVADFIFQALTWLQMLTAAMI